MHLSGWLLAYDSDGGSSSMPSRVCCKHLQEAGIVAMVLQKPSQGPEEGTRQTVSEANSFWLI